LDFGPLPFNLGASAKSDKKHDVGHATGCRSAQPEQVNSTFTKKSVELRTDSQPTACLFALGQEGAAE
jgi:hypothetical protein